MGVSVRRGVLGSPSAPPSYLFDDDCSTFTPAAGYLWSDDDQGNGVSSLDPVTFSPLTTFLCQCGFSGTCAAYRTANPGTVWPSKVLIEYWMYTDFSGSSAGPNPTCFINTSTTCQLLWKQIGTGINIYNGVTYLATGVVAPFDTWFKLGFDCDSSTCLCDVYVDDILKASGKSMRSVVGPLAVGSLTVGYTTYGQIGSQYRCWYDHLRITDRT